MVIEQHLVDEDDTMTTHDSAITRHRYNLPGEVDLLCLTIPRGWYDGMTDPLYVWETAGALVVWSTHGCTAVSRFPSDAELADDDDDMYHFGEARPVLESITDAMDTAVDEEFENPAGSDDEQRQAKYVAHILGNAYPAVRWSVERGFIHNEYRVCAEAV